MDQTATNLCPWCSAPIEANVHACPRCGAIVTGGDGLEVPGVTQVDPKADLGPEGRDLLSASPIDWLEVGRADTAGSADDEAVQPPSEAVRLEMRKMELEAEILNAGGAVMGPDGVARPVGPPSHEALEAEEAGLLDATGPAGETDLAELAHAWEADPAGNREGKA